MCDCDDLTIPVGPTGPKGNTGDSGPKGNTGDKGDNGTNGTNGINGKNKTDVTLSGNTSPYLSAAFGGYIEISTVIWDGSTYIGITPTLIEIVAKMSDIGSLGAIRIRDVTNGVTIAEITTVTGTTKTIFDIPILATASATRAIWEIQAKTTVGADALICLYALTIRH